VSVVGTLTVDLVANTATFTADLGAAGNSLDGLGKSAAKAGQDIDFSMTEAKGSMMLLGEEIGVKIPRHLQTLIAEIPMVGAAFATMLPLVGITAAIALITEVIKKSAEAKEKLAGSMANFGVVSNNVLNGLNDKLLEVGIKTDELAGHHLAALHKQLMLIDHASLHELAEEFNKLAGVADTVLGNLKVKWYEMHVGSEGAQHALNEFKGRYELLLSAGKKTEATNLLKGTLESAQASLHAMQTAGFVSRGLGEVSAEGIKAQQAWVSVLQTQLEVETKIGQIGKGEKANVQTEDKQHDDKDLEERNEAVKAFCDKALAAEREYDKQRAEARKKAAETIKEIAYAEAKGVEEAWKQQLKVTEELGKEEVREAVAMGKLQADADEQEARHKFAMGQSTAAQLESALLLASQRRLDLEKSALDKEHAQLEAAENKDLVAIRTIEDKKSQLIQQAAQQQTKIREDALQKQYQDTQRVDNQIAGDISKTLTQGILESKNMALAFKKMGAEMLESAMETTIKMILLNKEKKLSDAETAASAAYKQAMAAYPAPFNMVAAPMAAAAAFAGAMQFADGGEVPGVGSGDTVPAMLTPGETVVTKALTDQVKGSTGGGGHTFNFAPAIHAVDAEGVDRMLKKHQAVFSANMTSILRKHHLKG
jgi:hypothetical protein